MLLWQATSQLVLPPINPMGGSFFSRRFSRRPMRKTHPGRASVSLPGPTAVGGNYFEEPGATAGTAFFSAGCLLTGLVPRGGW